LPPFSPDDRRRLAVTVRGVVQGVGFRPFVYNRARALGLAGWVLNEAGTVRIEVQGTRDTIGVFLADLRERPPRQARIDGVELAELPPIDGEPGVFEIRASLGADSPRPTIPADLATCPECLAEILDFGRRHGYPFTNCTNCGPRWSIIERLPYDRPRTSMASFAMCPECRKEYENPSDRRFHAQPIACPACGPKLTLLDPAGARLAEGDAALNQAAEAVLSGRIVALKGLGGFQLLVDATNDESVERLRQRKHRHDKPLAVMIRHIEDVHRRCRVLTLEAEALASPAAPILLLRRRTDALARKDIAPSLAPGNPYLGVMLPYTPLHHLLMEKIDRPIVCTSGNLSEEPMATTTADALERLGSIADLLLVHDRPIVRPVDDSVARLGSRGLQVLRRARGYAPLPIPLSVAAECILAVGGHLKNTVGLTVGGQAVLSQHVGDLDNLASLEVHRRAIADLVDFFQVRPKAVACDLHPDYASTRVAEELSQEWNAPLVRVQHHHAHVAACMAEHGLAGPVLGLAWDGTGYGPDGTAWGGEILLCRDGDYSRVGRLRTFALPGGDRAAREPRRSALGLLFELFGSEAARIAGEWFLPAELKNLVRMLERRVYAPRTSSLGRLFDAVACLCGLGAEINFEGQAAMALEFACDPHETGAYEFKYAEAGAVLTADWTRLVHAVLEDRRRGVGAGRIAARFHNAIVQWAADAAVEADCRSVALSGGCFQNAILSERIERRLLQLGFDVYTQMMAPPGDGSIALGQLLVACEALEREKL
jgi:hydrogenase maturation protein HypF